ncbi:hypothetical protein B0H17DRAFT_1125755 [Mycena rosella]|uniref:Uncharacterized protein n=1 Tax=Mycena rosella TaxID=1033263 RepID=A0AAD7GWV6_MYCRO|nr:hypothetical protein B0H17DRAFT_1125755 [Mycena rosella]
MTARSECSVDSLLFEARLPPEPLTACEVTGRTAILPSRTRPANYFAQGLDGTGRHAADGTRHTRKYGDGHSTRRLIRQIKIKIHPVQALEARRQAKKRDPSDLLVEGLQTQTSTITGKNWTIAHPISQVECNTVELSAGIQSVVDTTQDIRRLKIPPERWRNTNRIIRKTSRT